MFTKRHGFLHEILMKTSYIWLSSILILAILLMACQTPTPPPEKPQQPATTSETPSEVSPTAQDIPITQPIVNVANPENPEGKLKESGERVSLENQQEKVFIAHLIRSAKNKIAEYDYASAKAFLDKALQIQPDHKEAQDLRSFVGTFFGENQARANTLHAMYENEVKVKIDQAKLEAKNHYKSGMDAFNKKDYTQAVREFESSLEIIKWAPYQLGLDSMRLDAEAKIKEAKRLQEEWLAQQNAERMREAQKKAEQLEAEEQAQRFTQIRILMTRATEFYTQQRYDKADAMITEILKIDPANKAAVRLQGDIRDANHSLVSKKTLETRIEEWKLFIEDMRRSAIPTSELIKYPDKDYWHNIISKRKSESELGRTQEDFIQEDSPAIQEIKRKLQSEKLPLINFSDTPFQDVVKFIQSEAKINIVVDPKVIQKFEIEGTKVTLQVNDIKIQDAIMILLQFHDLIYIFKDDVLFITSKTADLAKDKPIPVLHDIRDLTGQIKDFPGPRIKLSVTRDETGGGGAKFEEADSTTGSVITGERLTELIKTSIDPESWDKDEVSVAETSGQLLVVHTQKVQEEIRNFLNDLRRFSGMMVAMESRFLEVTDDFLEHVGVDWRGLGNDDLQSNVRTPSSSDINDDQNLVDKDNNNIVMPGVTKGSGGGTNDNAAYLARNTSNNPSAGMFFRQSTSSRTNVNGDETAQGSFDMRARTEHIDDQTVGSRLQKTGGLAIQLATLDDTQLSAVLWFIKKTGRAEVLMSPRLTAFNTQRAHLTVVNQSSYIKDYDVEVAQSAYIADPVIGTIQSGVVLDVRPIISNDRKYITLELRPTVATLMSFRDFKTSLGAANKEVTFQIPQLKLQSIETTVRIPDQGTLMLGGLKNYRNVDHKLDIPLLGNIPIISFFFSQQSKSDEKQDLLILIKAKIIDLEEEEEKAVGLRK